MSVIKGEGKFPILFGTKSVVSGPLTHDAYLARPDIAGEWPTVLIVPGAWGVTPAVKDVARRLARYGVAGIVADPYRSAPPPWKSSRADALAGLATVPEERILRDVADLVRYIENPAGFWSSAEHGFGVMGIGAGGPVAGRVAASTDSCLVLVSSAPDPAALAGITAPVLGLAGKDDEFAPADAITAARRALPQAEWVLYEGVGSDFFDDAREGFDQAAFTDAMERTLGFVEKHLPPAP